MKKSIAKEKEEKYIKLEDYQVFDFEIPDIYLDFVIEEEKVIVKTTLKLIKKNKRVKNISLNGINIIIESIYLDDSLLEEKNYSHLPY